MEAKFNHLFELKDYKDYLLNVESDKSTTKFGFRSRLAECTSCKPAFISQVLNGPQNFSLEQAEAVSRFLGHSELEKKIFLTLVELARAGTVPLKKYFEAQLKQLQQESTRTHKRIGFDNDLSLSDQAIFYSHWSYTAVHVLVSLPEYQYYAKIKSALNLTDEKLIEVIEFLMSIGLVEKRDTQILPTKKGIFISAESPLIFQHHRNWREKTIQLYDHADGSGFHYSSVMTLALADIPVIKEILIKALEGIRKVIKESKDETVLNLNLDFHKVI